MKRWGIFSLALLVVVLDQITKSIVTGRFVLDGTYDLIPGFLAFTYIRNTGGAFGIMQHGTAALVVTALLTIAAIVVFVLRAGSTMPRLLAVAFALPLGGAVGNLIDRVRLGYVVDFLDAHVQVHHWPIFNIADSAITIGVLLLAYHFWSVPSEQPAPARLKEKT